MVGVAPDADQPRANRPCREEIGALDQPQPRIEPVPADEQRRDRQEHLVDEPVGKQGADHGRAALREDQPVPELVEARDRGRQVELG